MSVSYILVVLQLLLLIIVWIVERLIFKITTSPHQPKKNRHCWWIWTLIFWSLIIWNLGYYWPAYPIALWMVWALVLIVIQVFHHHEFIYRRYWPVFWRLSAYYALLVYICGIVVAPWLPLI